MYMVRTLADSGPGSMRDALAKAAHGGGTIRFAVGGEIDLRSGLGIPSHTTVDGSSAPSPGITLWGEHAGARGTGVVDIYEGDVVVRGVRVRNGMNDGFHVVPGNGHPISNIVVAHCSITNHADGGIDITGYRGLGVTNVTVIGNYIAGNGGPCAKGTCGGGSLVKDNASRVSFYYNFWDKNLRRTPAVSADNRDHAVVADIRYNVVREPEQSGIQIREAAMANVISNTLQGSRAKVTIKLWHGLAYVRDNASDLDGPGNIAELPVPDGARALSAADVTTNAGVLPRDAVDTYYIDTARTFADVKAKPFHAAAAVPAAGAPPSAPARRPDARRRTPGGSRTRR